MALIVGAALALIVGAMATAVGLDRDRAMYPVAMLVIAAYYVLFAAMGASTGTLALEAAIAAGFAIAAVIGFRSSLWVVVVALAGHGVFDLVHEHVVHNPGVPPFWADFCSAYDLVAAAYLAWLLRKAPQVTAWTPPEPAAKPAIRPPSHRPRPTA